MVKVDAAFERGLWDVREGRVKFDDFARKQKRVWEALAKYLLRRWSVGTWVTKEDVVQDVMLGAWGAIWNYEPAHPNAPPLAMYVIYNATDKAKKLLHRYRGALLSGNADAHPSCIDVPVDTHVASFMDSSPADQDEVAHRSEVIRRAITKSRSKVERRALEAAVKAGEIGGLIVGDDLSLAISAQELYSDATARKACKLGSEETALRVVIQAAQGITERLIAA